MEDGLLANARATGYPPTASVTGVGTGRGRRGRRHRPRPHGEGGLVGRPDRARSRSGSWSGPTATCCRCSTWSTRPAGGSTEQLGFFPAAGARSRIFQLQVALSGRVPQICCLFGPSAAGGAYMPAFTDWVGMVDGNASMYLASPRVAEMVTGERTTLEEMGGARMHTTVSGCADSCAARRRRGHRRGPPAVRLPARSLERRPPARRSAAVEPAGTTGTDVIPAARAAPTTSRPGDRRRLVDAG